MSNSSTERIVPLSIYQPAPEQARLAVELAAAVQQPHVLEHLESRHLLGVIANYGPLARPRVIENNVYEMYKDHNSHVLGAFVLRGYEDQVIGLATINPRPDLRRQRFPLPPSLVKGRMAVKHPVQGPQISAWVAPGEGLEGGEILTQAYRELGNPNGVAHTFYTTHDLMRTDTTLPIRAWALEPFDSKPWVHRSIRDAGLSVLKDVGGHFDDGNAQTRRAIPPYAGIYIQEAIN